MQGTAFHLLEVLTVQANIELFVVSVDLFVFSPLEQRLAHQKDVEDRTQRENIAARLNVLRLRKLDYLRSDIPRGSTPEEKVLLEIDVTGKTEIHDNWLESTATQHDILRFEVTMHDPMTVDVPQTSKHTRSDRFYLLFRKVSLSFLDGLEKGLSRQQLKHNIDRVVRFEHCL